MYIRLILTCFEAVSSLIVNMTKGEMVPIGEVQNLPVLANILSYKIGALPTNNHGMPLGSFFKSLIVRNRIFEKMERRLAGWQRLALPLGSPY